MTNLIFDLNNIAHRSMFVVGGYGAKQFTFDSQSEVDQLMRKMAIDIAYIIRLINPSRIIFALDSRSWRKDIKIDENEGYKGTRKKSSHINWDNVYAALNEFSELMASNGMVVSKIENAEADDVIALWANEIQINLNQHIIIVSGDEDLRQLVNEFPYEHKFSFTTVFNPFMQGKNASRKLYVSQYFEEWLNTGDAVDFMNMKGTIDLDKEDFRKIITSERTKLEVVDGNMIALRKIFCGDDGDNIPAIYSWLNDKEAVIRITNSKFEKIYEMLRTFPEEVIIPANLLERSDEILKAIKSISKQNIALNMYDRIERQLKLVVLNKEYFPKEIIQIFEDVKAIELERPKINYGSLNMHDLLEGTRYVSEQNTENEANIFKQIDRIAGKLF